MRIDVVTFRTCLPALALAATVGCGPSRGGTVSKVPVSVARVERRSLPYELDATGTVEPIRSVDVLPQVNGTILHVNFAEGDEVAAGQLLLATDPRPYRAALQPTKPALRQRAGQQLNAIALPARDSASAVQGMLSFVDNQVDTATGTVLLKARFPNHDGSLWPGEFVRITLVLGVQNDAIVVPSQAVMEGQQGTYVFVVNNDGTAATQPITVER